MNKDKLLSLLSLGLSKREIPISRWIDLESRLHFSLDEFLDKIYISPERSHSRIDIYFEGEDAFFRIAGFKPELDSDLESRGICNVFYFSER